MDYVINYDQTGRVSSIIRTVDNVSIPKDENNRYYQEFLTWNAAQAQPLKLTDLPEGVNPQMIPNYAALRDELTKDPAQIGYNVSTNSPANIADLINKKSFSTPGVVPMTSVLKWAATGPRATLQDAANDKTSPVRSIALACLDLLIGGFSSLDLSDPSIQTMLQTLISAGLITKAQSDTLIAQASIPASRAEILFGAGVLVAAADISAVI